MNTSRIKNDRMNTFIYIYDDTKELYIQKSQQKMEKIMNYFIYFILFVRIHQIKKRVKRRIK